MLPKSLKITTTWDPNPFQLHEVYRLRHRVIREKFGWLPWDKDRVDIDRFDNQVNTRHLLALRGERVAGYLRVIMGRSLDDFMMGKEFFPFLGESKQEIVKLLEDFPGTVVEVSRLVVQPELPKITQQVIRYKLYTEGLAWASANHKTHAMLVTTEELYQELQSNLSFVVTRHTNGCVVGVIDIQEKPELLLATSRQARLLAARYR